jgi:hypothetical protein
MLSLEYENTITHFTVWMLFLSGHHKVWFSLNQQTGIAMLMGVVEYSAPGLHQQEVLSRLGHLQALAVGKKVMVKCQVHPAVNLLLNTNHLLLTTAE